MLVLWHHGVGRAISHRLLVSGSQLLTGKCTNVLWMSDLVQRCSWNCFYCSGGRSFSPQSIQDLLVRLGGAERYQEGHRPFSELSFSGRTK